MKVEYVLPKGYRWVRAKERLALLDKVPSGKFLYRLEWASIPKFYAYGFAGSEKYIIRKIRKKKC